MCRKPHRHAFAQKFDLVIPSIFLDNECGLRASYMNDALMTRIESGERSSIQQQKHVTTQNGYIP
jgi:hypothetical protein